ncbi:hypothetical protein [Dyadobacter sp. 3J3]|uniref:hypothetical protein n=1 Tax=Dyadobacter sp. 3J3 TaxID=2606600 RepID=UPI0013587D0B|nr:hypothetical protein [Dyadobacter sp. 3J3]
MKKTLLIGLTAFICYAGSVMAQLQPGVKYVGATINFNGYNQNSDFGYNNNNIKSNLISINPSLQFGKFIKENRMIGIGLGTNIILVNGKTLSSNVVYHGRTTNVAYSLSPYIRHYKSLSPKWAVFLNSSVVLTYSHNKSSGNQLPTTKTDGYAGGIQLTPGISYWITPRFALESDLNFLSLAAGYQSLWGEKNMYFNSAVTSDLTRSFSVRAAWYLQKQ